MSLVDASSPGAHSWAFSILGTRDAKFAEGHVKGVWWDVWQYYTTRIITLTRCPGHMAATFHLNVAIDGPAGRGLLDVPVDQSTTLADLLEGFTR